MYRLALPPNSIIFYATPVGSLLPGESRLTGGTASIPGGLFLAVRLSEWARAPIGRLTLMLMSTPNSIPLK
jgi:hypothetical protein